MRPPQLYLASAGIVLSVRRWVISSPHCCTSSYSAKSNATIRYRPALALYPRRPANSNTTPIMTMLDATHSHAETVSAPSVTPRNSATTGFTNE